MKHKTIRPFWVGVVPQQPTSRDYVLVVTDEAGYRQGRIPPWLAVVVNGRDTTPEVKHATCPADAARLYLSSRPGLAERVPVMVVRIGGRPDEPLQIGVSTPDLVDYTVVTAAVIGLLLVVVLLVNSL